jgi:DNA-binding beta-propeller fold protein YncE
VLRALGLVFVALFSGCNNSPAPKPVATQTPTSSLQVWGERGANAGEFFEPRAIVIAPNNFAYLVDSTGRIQKWTLDGKFVSFWRPPTIENGRPEGVAVLKDGNIAVTDTHYSRVLIYSPSGKMLRKFGSYGKKPGQFLLVTGICVDGDGNIYTADYGGDFDRISKWTPEGVLLAAWPGHGEDPRQFRRPCGLAISKNGDLLVADIGNHRIQILDRFTGKYKGQIGQQGREPGAFTYPYDVAVAPVSGNIYTVEYGAHRVQKWSPDGKFLGSFGEPGRKSGQFANPWGLAVDKDENVYVCDTQNHRVQKFRF